MGFSGRYSIAITILLLSIVREGFGELIAIRHPPTDEGDTVKFTCITEELDAALIWNYDHTTGNVGRINNFTSSYSEVGDSETTDGCQIRTLDSGSCIVELGLEASGWGDVTTVSFPMAPVHDYRWEGFNESIIDSLAIWEWRPLYSHTIVFSARGSRLVRVVIREKESREQDSCIWILIGSKDDGKSKNLTCNGGKPTDSLTGAKHCKHLRNAKLVGENELEPNEWHTFSIEWGEGNNIVKVFEDFHETPFLQGTVGNRSYGGYEYTVHGDLGTRVRVHDYEYWQTKLSYTVISTAAPFQTVKDELCFELMFGLCSHCGLMIHLLNGKNRSVIDTQTIFGNERSTTHGLLAWKSRSIKLSIKTPQLDNPLSLEFGTLLKDHKGVRGHWAMDKVRPCRPRGTIRATTITVRKPETAANNYRLPIACQIISDEGSDTIDPSANYPRDLDTSHLGQALEVWRKYCGSSCEGFGNGSLICNSRGCGCERGFQGENCTVECTLGSYGSNCSEECGFCKNKKCNKETGRCEDGCESVELGSPFCQRVEPSLGGQNLSWLVVFPILGMILMWLHIWYRKRTKAPAMSWPQPSYLEIIPSTPAVGSGNSHSALVGPINLAHQPAADRSRSSAYLYSMPDEPDSWRVPVENFEEYVKNAVTSAQLNSQFKLLPRGSTKPSHYGRCLGNLQKNRSTNSIAYDDTRVILRRIPGDPYSDYINANYVRGFGKERAYIATQGPMSNTVEDFWRMVWQEDVRIVCMLTNVIEDGENKCVQYWPDVGAEVRYGDIVISNAGHQVFADFTFRSLELRCQQQSREVSHLHYTGWPSHGIPTYPQSLTLYLKKLLKLPTGDGPVVVHCNTGDDRTGTIILCDICLREVVWTKAIDLPDVTTRLRESRANMVGTLQQFLLAHIMITEVLMARPTQVPCDNIFPKRMRQLRNRLPCDVERLNETMWQQQTLKSLAEPMPLGIADDADNELSGEGTPGVVYANLHSTFEKRIGEIGAVSVDGVKVKRQHLASHLPPPLKLSEFWRFVTENGVKLIIILQSSDPGNPNCADIMPDETIVHQMSIVEFIAETNSQNADEAECFKSEKVTLVEASEENAEPRAVTVLTCRGWARGSNGKPPEPVALVSLWTASERVLREEGQTLVLCHDGITACGLYLAMSFLLERMAVERECDVISAIRAVRRSRPDFVQSVEQCEYLYDAAEKYAEYFECYANFT